MTKKILFGAEYSILDPLGLFHLSSIAKQEGFESKIVLGKRPDYNEFEKAIKEFNPNFFGITVYTGNHMDIIKYLREIKRRDNGLTTIIGGPHPTYFPRDSKEYADFIVIGEGFDSLRKILRKEVNKGIVHLTKTEDFPDADREEFYRENPEHDHNPIKNVITSVGCPFNCTHCYNSSNIQEIEGFSLEQMREMENALDSKRFFPLTQRKVDKVIEEIDKLEKISPQTKMLFLEDDVFGIDLDWLKEFTKKYAARMPFHANMRFEFVDPTKEHGKRRIELLKQAGCTGLSLAIESGGETIRREILNRKTPEDLMFRVMNSLKENEFRVRTYQMLGLPYGVTSKETKMNLEADIETLELNVRLREETGLPTFSWASTLTPYPGTKIAKYCSKHGFYKGGLEDISGDETYRIKSVLKHLKKWVGSKPITDLDRLSEEQQERYKTQLNHLMNYFPIFAKIKKGHKLAKEFLEGGDLSSSGLNKSVRNHLYEYDLFGIK